MLALSDSNHQLNPLASCQGSEASTLPRFQSAYLGPSLFRAGSCQGLYLNEAGSGVDDLYEGALEQLVPVEGKVCTRKKAILVFLQTFFQIKQFITPSRKAYAKRFLYLQQRSWTG